MGYFDALVDVAKTLTNEAAGLLETTEGFKATLTTTRDELLRDFTEDDIIENMGDVDFANDFAHSLWETLDNLMKKCDEVSEDCVQRKRRMDVALSGLGAEAVVELSADTDLSEQFFDVHDRCANWFNTLGEQIIGI